MFVFITVPDFITRVQRLPKRTLYRRIPSSPCHYRQERFRHLRANDPKFRNKAPSANSRQRMEQARERGDEEGARKIADGSMRRFAPPGKTLSDLD